MSREEVFTEEELNSIIDRCNDYLNLYGNGGDVDYIIENMMKAAERLKNRVYNADYIDKD